MSDLARTECPHCGRTVPEHVLKQPSPHCRHCGRIIPPARCTRSETCEFAPEHWPATPCGRPVVTCPTCGFPLPRETDEDIEEVRECPHGWRTATVADLKGLAAEEGWDTEVEVGPDGVKATIIPPSNDDHGEAN